MKELVGLVPNWEALLLDKYSEYYFFKKSSNPSSTFSPSLFLSLSLSMPLRGDAERGPTTLAGEPRTSQAPRPRRYSRRPRPRRPSYHPPPPPRSYQPRPPLHHWTPRHPRPYEDLRPSPHPPPGPRPLPSPRPRPRPLQNLPPRWYQTRCP